MILYTDNDPFCCGVLRARVEDGSLLDGRVLEKNVESVTADDLAGYRQIHLFAGIGGFALAQKWADWPSDWTLTTGGFPCQDISCAGTGEGLDGDRSGLWTEYARIIDLVRPKFAIVENVAALTFRGLGRILADLSRLGYDAEWSNFSACSVGATHMRQRMFIVAYPNGLNGWAGLRHTFARQDRTLQAINRFAGARTGWKARMANPSELYRGADGLPNCMDRNRAIGNAIVPQVAEEIMKAIKDAKNDSHV